MESILESFRLLHEERERLLDEMVQEMVYRKRNLREEINSGHRFRLHLDRYMKVSQKLVDMYEDKDDLKKEEVASISGANEFAEFYGRIRNSKEYHRKFPDTVDTLNAEFESFKKAREKNIDEENLVDFTDEESYGKFIDLHSFYNQFMNMSSIKTNQRFTRLTYLEYLNIVPNLSDLSFEAKRNQDYEDYVSSLKSYLHSFICRSKPLLDIDAELSNGLKQFDNQWTCGDFPGWSTAIFNTILNQSSANLQVCQLIDFNRYDTPKDLENLGLEELKTILQKLGLKCGGNLEQRANRLFSLKSTPIEELDKSLFLSKKRNHGEMIENGHQCSNKTVDDYKKLAFMEAHIYLYFDILKEELEATKDNIERKQARTADEIMLEEEGVQVEETIESEDEDFQDGTLYNPKNLPLDFDGKPIPYWLYKLHGLNIYYNCEICGNSKYRGPKAFQRHFGEWRHAHGMRCLGIPNTAHFVNVTKIQDAYNLWDVIKNNKLKEHWNPDVDEEFEDSDGNPINKKIFDDMRRQGLL